MDQEEIVISGIAGRFPESDDIAEFWSKLIAGVDLVTDDPRRYPNDYLGLPRRTAKLKRLDQFDSEYFDVPDNVAHELNPQVRILYETTFEAICDAGVNPDNLRGTNTGQYMGCCDYDTESAQREDDGNPVPFFQNLSGRIAQAFDFRGPFCMTDTACASSFNALNEAVRAIRAGICDQAIVSGLGVHASPYVSLKYHIMQMTCQEGKSKALDASADGYVRAEAVISILIQKRSQAKRIYATVLKTRTNTDGFKKEGMTYPRVSTQRDLMIETYRDAGIDPLQLSYMEAHLTGTPAGDPVESQAIMEACCQGRTKPLLLGAMKSNMGHAEGASGIAAVTKACLAFQHLELPPNLHFKNPNPAIQGLMSGVLKPVVKRMKFEEDLIGLNSFGIGGANVHTILRANQKRALASEPSIPLLIPICGRTKEAIRNGFEYIERNASKVTTEFVALMEESMSIQPHPKGMCERGFAICGSAKIEKMATAKNEKPLWCIFSGLGSQWRPMALSLMPIKIFAESIQACNDISMKNYHMDLLVYLNTTDPVQISSELIYLAITSVQIALVDLIRALNIKPDGFIGHSLGEVAAAYADGAISKEEALGTSYVMGTLPVQLLNHKGAMVATDLTWKEAVSRVPQHVYAACHNGSKSVTIAGLPDEVKQFAAQLASEERFVRQVDSNELPFHCPLIGPINGKIERALAKVIKNPKQRSPKWISCSITEPSLADSVYFSNMMANPVRFYESFQHIPKDAAIIEIGPHTQLLSQLKAYNPSLTCIPMMKKGNEHNLEMVLSAIGQIYNCGHNPTISKLYPPINWPVSRETLSISPMIKWNHEREWKVYKFPQSFNIAARSPQFTIDSNMQKYKFLFGHCIDGRVLFPATGYLGLAWQFLAQTLGYSSQYDVSVEFQNVKFHRATILSKSAPTIFEMSLNPQTNEFAVVESGTVCCSGLVKIIDKEIPALLLDANQKVTHGSSAFKLQNKDIYKELRVRGYDYGPSFQGLIEASVDGTWGRVKWPGNWIAFADTVLQLIILPTSVRSLFVPTFIEYMACDIKSFLAEVQRSKKDQDESVLTVRADPDAKCLSTNGFVIKGLKASSIPRRMNLANASLEAHNYNPYMDHLEATSTQMASIEKYTKLCEALWNRIDKKEPIEQKVQEEIDAMTSGPKHLVLNQLNQISKMEENGVPLITKLKEALLDQESFTADLLNAMAFESEPFCRPMVETIVENFNVKTPKIAEFHFKGATPLSGQLSKALDIATVRCEKSSYGFDVQPSKIPNGSLHLALIHDPTFDTLKKSHDQIQQLLGKTYDKMADGGMILIVYREKLTDFEQKIGNLMGDDCSSQCPLTNGLNLIKLACRNFNETHGLLLLRKPSIISASERLIINVTNNNYNWINEVKANLYNDKNIKRVWLISKDMNTSGLLGFVNCIRKEVGREKIRCLFGSDQLTDDILEKDLVNNVFKSGIYGRYQHQLISTSNKPKPVEHAYLDVAAKGDLTSLKWFESPNKYWNPSSASTTLFNIHYSALNFKDIMVATGRIPTDAYPGADASEGVLGMEFSGTDQQGRRIMGFHTTNCIASSVEIEDLSLIWPVPDQWSLAEAATVPVVYITVYYSLIVRGRLRPGESVLIHAGSGGVGQAALSVCLTMGCEVFTTVGSQAKREFLLKKFPKLREDHIGNSRDLSFEEMILKATNGQGVDVVLNSLSDEKFKASVNCLAKGGRFVEIGKYDLVQNTKLDLSLFTENKEYHAACVAHLTHDATVNRTPSAIKICQQINKLLLDGIQRGEIQPLPYHTFSKDHCEEAFRFMANGKHIGKVLIEIRPSDTTTISINAYQRTYFDPSKSYLITGGLGGFGLEIADWLVKRGAKKIILTSRRGITTQYQQFVIDRLIKKDIEIRILINDLLSEQNTDELITHANQIAPIGGIFHLAMVLNDAAFENMTPELFEQVCAAKVKGTIYLDQVSRKRCPKLDYFVCFSSVACGRGNAGQTNYGFANSAMERICEKRKEDGLHGLAIQWGAIGDVGVIAEHFGGNDVVLGNTIPQRIPSCIEALDRFMQSDDTVVSSIVHVDKTDTTSSRAGLLLHICHIMGVKDPSALTNDTMLNNLGIDSLMAVEIKQIIELEYSIVMTTKEIRELRVGQIKEMEQTLTKQSSKQVTDMNNNQEDQYKFTLEPPTELFLTLNASTEGLTGRPIFLLPPIEADFTSLHSLVAQLPRPAIGLNWTAELDQFDTVEQVATFYVEKLRENYPDNQYDILGYSLGGIVALEMAIQIQQRFGDNHVKKLLLLDSSPSYVRAMADTVSARHHLELTEEGGRTDFLLSFIALMFAVGLDEQNRLRTLIGNCTSEAERSETIVKFVTEQLGEEFDASILSSSADRYFKKSRMSSQYAPTRKFNGNLKLLRATESGFDKANLVQMDEKYGLNENVNGKLEYLLLNGDHKSFLVENAKEIADEIDLFFQYMAVA